LSRLIGILSYPFQLLFAAPIGLLSASRALRGSSLPVRSAIVVGLLLLLLTVVGTVLSGFAQNSPDFWGAVVPRYTLPLLGFTLIIPPLVYLVVWLWSAGPASRHPDIDRAWQEGTAALAREGLSLAECPVFLVLGLRNERQARAFMNAAGLKYAVTGAPEGGSNPLYFYAVKDYPLKKDEAWNLVYLVLTDTSQLSKLVAVASDSSGRERIVRDADDTVRAGDLRGSLVRPQVAAGGTEGTIREDGGLSATAIEEPLTARGPVNLRGTMDLSDLSRTRTESSPLDAVSEPRYHAEVLDKTEQNRQEDRLAYVCRLLERDRDPFCTLNGVLVVTPFGLLRRGLEQVKHLAQATRQDLRTVQRRAHLRCPVISLIGGMEHEAGFGELVRRVGAAPAIEQRIGMRFDPWNPATRERLEALANHACDRVEGNVYDLFKMHDGYNKPGNGKLYNLICRTRTGFTDLLKTYLAGAFAEADERPMLFAGCYFAATGEIERLKGFLKSVLADRMLENQDDLQWTDEALGNDRLCQTWAAACMLIAGLVVVGTVAAFFVPRK